MRFTLRATFTSLVLSLSSTSINAAATPPSVTAIAFASTVSCSGANFNCPNLAPNICCGPFPSGFGVSAQFSNLPLGDDGQGFSVAGCTGTAIFTLFGDNTNKCFNGGGKSTAVSLLYFADVGKREAEAECVAPSVFEYADHKGVNRRIKVSTLEAAEQIAQLSRANNFDALSRFAAA